jgi:hypothetical protein
MAVKINSSGMESGDSQEVKQREQEQVESGKKGRLICNEP